MDTLGSGAVVQAIPPGGLEGTRQTDTSPGDCRSFRSATLEVFSYDIQDHRSTPEVAGGDPATLNS
jgi:hypothetical protein